MIFLVLRSQMEEVKWYYIV